MPSVRITWQGPVVLGFVLVVLALWMHVSHIAVGAPFNAEQEDWFESCGVKFRLERR